MLSERDKQDLAELERFKKTFGLGPKRTARPPLSEEHFDGYRQQVRPVRRAG